MDKTQFKELHTSCMTALRNYITSAELTATMLERCTRNPWPWQIGWTLLIQESAEHKSHSIYLGTKRILHNAARLGYRYSD